MSYLLAAYGIVLASAAAYAVWLGRRRTELAERLAGTERPRRDG